jgi:hypothetical protein
MILGSAKSTGAWVTPSSTGCAAAEDVRHKINSEFVEEVEVVCSGRTDQRAVENSSVPCRNRSVRLDPAALAVAR